MKVPVITKAVQLVDQAAARVESFARRGEVKVVSMLCRDCGQWVEPDDWNPAHAVCDLCTSHVLRAAASGRFGNSGYRHTFGPRVWGGAR